MSLLADITRCHDTGCPEREQCRRWLERDSGTVHVQSLFPYDEDINSQCSLRIPPITTETMSNNDHPITPPPELVQQWWDGTHGAFYEFEAVTTQAARWGWDQRDETIEAELQEARDVELEACCADIHTVYGKKQADWLRSLRRPKPPSLKAQAIAQAIAVLDDCSDRIDAAHENIIRRALEALMTDLIPNDLSHMSDDDFNALCPQGHHAPGPEPLSPAAQAVSNAAKSSLDWEAGYLPNAVAAAALRAAADRAKRGPEHWEGSYPDDYDKGWNEAVDYFTTIATELKNHHG